MVVDKQPFISMNVEICLTSVFVSVKLCDSTLKFHPDGWLHNARRLQPSASLMPEVTLWVWIRQDYLYKLNWIQTKSTGVKPQSCSNKKVWIWINLDNSSGNQSRQSWRWNTEPQEHMRWGGNWLFRCFQRAGEKDELWEDRRAMTSEETEAAAVGNRCTKWRVNRRINGPFLWTELILSILWLSVWHICGHHTSFQLRRFCSALVN